jgi:hypothetical protein
MIGDDEVCETTRYRLIVIRAGREVCVATNGMYLWHQEYR